MKSGRQGSFSKPFLTGGDSTLHRQCWVTAFKPVFCSSAVHPTSP